MIDATTICAYRPADASTTARPVDRRSLPVHAAAPSGNHHDLGLFGVGRCGGPRRRGAIGLYHLAWQLDTIDELAGARDSLVRADAFTGESSHGATLSLDGADPDGIEFEIMWLLPRDEWGAYEHQAVIERLELDAAIARWSGVRTGWELPDDGDADPS